MFVVIPITKYHREILVIAMYFFSGVKEEGCAQAIDVLALEKGKEREKARWPNSDIRMRGREPNSFPIGQTS